MLSADLPSFLHAQGADMLGRSRPPRAVRVRRHGSVWRTELDFGDAQASLVVKPIAANCQLADAARLSQVQAALRGKSAALAQRLVPIVGVEPQRHWIVMPEVAGASLEEVARRALRGDAAAAARVGPALDAAAATIAQVHAQRGQDLSLEPFAQPNSRYVASMQKAWAHGLMRRCLPTGVKHDTLFAQVCDERFASRMGDRALPLDVQPKNVLLAERGAGITLIDPDYTCGNPALTLANMLLNLDRLTLRHPGQRSAARVEAWKARFLRAYSQVGEAGVLEDTLAFYPWMVVRVFEQHVRARPWAMPLLAIGYGRLLRRFTHQLWHSADRACLVFS